MINLTEMVLMNNRNFKSIRIKFCIWSSYKKMELKPKNNNILIVNMTNLKKKRKSQYSNYITQTK